MEIAIATADTLATLDPASVSMMPHCWAQYNDVHCRMPSPASPRAAFEAGWTMLSVSLASVPSRPAFFGSTLLVSLCPEHGTDDMISAVFDVFGLHARIWDDAIFALDSRRLRIHRECPECHRVVDPQWTPSDPLPDGCHAVCTFLGGSFAGGSVQLACPEHTYALWDFSLGI